MWSLDKFRLYTEGHKIKLVTDHRPLQYIFENTESKSKLVRWALRLQTYDLEISYIKGKENVVADALSRLPVQLPSAPIDEDAFDFEHAMPELLQTSNLCHS